MKTTHDLAALVAAIDAGDDSALPALADLLEEQGDRRAAGLRRAAAHRPVQRKTGRWWWWDERDVSPAAIRRMVANGALQWVAGDNDALIGSGHASRSSAYLALGEVIGE